MKNSVRLTLIKLHWFLDSQLGFNSLRFLRSLRGLPMFLSDLRTFRKSYKGKIKLMPCLHDRYEEGGITKSEYFWQDLLVARWIHLNVPKKHVDIGSRVDGFVAHVAAFREIEVFDVRPITTTIPGVVFRQADLMNATTLPGMKKGYCDSLSCLHALEHFGLGRYGDQINPIGYRLGLKNMAKLLRLGGIFYLSIPIGKERIEFNANWVFDPNTIVNVAAENGLALKALTIYSHVNGIRELEPSESMLSDLANQHYNLGIFTFIKTTEGD
jgi:hypothetical protein